MAHAHRRSACAANELSSGAANKYSLRCKARDARKTSARRRPRRWSHIYAAYISDVDEINQRTKQTYNQRREHMHTRQQTRVAGRRRVLPAVPSIAAYLSTMSVALACTLVDHWSTSSWMALFIYAQRRSRRNRTPRCVHSVDGCKQTRRLRSRGISVNLRPNVARRSLFAESIYGGDARRKRRDRKHS